jgi:hypothetical protein
VIVAGVDTPLALAISQLLPESVRALAVKLAVPKVLFTAIVCTGGTSPFVTNWKESAVGEMVGDAFALTDAFTTTLVVAPPPLIVNTPV